MISDVEDLLFHCQKLLINGSSVRAQGILQGSWTLFLAALEGELTSELNDDGDRSGHKGRKEQEGTHNRR